MLPARPSRLEAGSAAATTSISAVARRTRRIWSWQPSRMSAAASLPSQACDMKPVYWLAIAACSSGMCCSMCRVSRSVSLLLASNSRSTRVARSLASSLMRITGSTASTVEPRAASRLVSASLSGSSMKSLPAGSSLPLTVLPKQTLAIAAGARYLVVELKTLLL